MARVIACDVEAMSLFAGRIRGIGAQIRAHDLRVSLGDAFLGAPPGAEQSLTDLLAAASRGRDAIADDLEALARAIELAALEFAEAERSLVTALSGFLADDPGEGGPR